MIEFLDCVCRCDPVEEVEDVEIFIPWFLACNPDRFPYWFGRPDPRNEDLFHQLTLYFQ